MTRSTSTITAIATTLCVLSCVSAAQSVGAQGSGAATGTLTGMKIDEHGRPFIAPQSPGATVSVKVPSNQPPCVTTKVTPQTPLPQVKCFLQSYGPDSDTFRDSLPAGNYEVGVGVPDGYDVSYSVCRDCSRHPSSSYVKYGNYNAAPLVVAIEAGHTIDVAWMFTKTGRTLIPTYTASGQTLQPLPDSELTKQTSQRLTCNVPPTKQYPATDTQTFKQGTDAWAEVGLTRDLGDIGVLFSLINPAAPQQPLQMIDSRSPAGASWMTGLGMTLPDKSVVNYTQGVGNSETNWGYGSELASGPAYGFVQKDWIPLYAVNVSPGAGSGIMADLSPCYHTGYRFGVGRREISPSAVPVTINGEVKNVLRLKSTYRMIVNGDQNGIGKLTPTSLGTSNIDTGMYIPLDITDKISGNLRIYFAAPKGVADVTSSVIGPIYAHDYYWPEPFPADAVAQFHCKDPGPKNDACFFRTFPTEYAVLVWNVAGKDIAMAVHKTVKINEVVQATTFTFEIAVRQLLHNFQFHQIYYPPNGFSFKNGDSLEETVYYDIGTPDEVAALGYSTHP